MERPVHLGVNTLVYERDGFIIKRYGCCGMFQFLAGDSTTRRILKTGFQTEKDAEDWIEIRKKAILEKEVDYA